MKLTLLSLVSVVCVAGPGIALWADTPDSSPPSETATLSEPAANGVRRALIVCGHPGDDEHRALFAETAEQLQSALVDRYGFDADAVWVLFGGEDPPPADPGLESPHGPSTAEGISQAVAELRSAIGPNDAVWVIAIGHSNYDRRHSWFNLPGPDLHEESFAALFNELTCREQVFWITLPASGYYIKPLSAPGRIIITATEADRELNETSFPHVMADVLRADPPADTSTPANNATPADSTTPADTPTSSEAVTPAGTTAAAAEHSSSQTLLELYLAITRRVAEQFAADMQVATEHAQLEANGDGKGSEVQFGHLPEALGGGLQEGESPQAPLPNSDEAAAAAVVFQRTYPAPVTPSESPAATPETETPAIDDSPSEDR